MLYRESYNMVELAWRERERGLEGMEIRRELGEGKARGKGSVRTRKGTSMERKRKRGGG